MRVSCAVSKPFRAAFQTAVSTIYPPRCLGCGALVDSDFGLCSSCWRETPFIGGLVCDSCGLPLQGAGDGHRIECDHCMTRPRPWAQGRAALLYADRARALVLALKHGDRPDVARSAARWMGQAARPILRPGALVVPVPLHWTRLLRRRYNQAALLARGVAAQAGMDHCADLLHRFRRTPMLEHATADDRFATLRSAIRVHPRRAHLLPGRPVLLIDDVMTSGATLSACAKACRAAGAAVVDVLTLARVALDD
ncbi:ComF family protein [Pseudodonghicola flavimaris]|uniref:ComF family protein n=1 Tax=Pseudodonghicola flavimaris TaxID=3050036 RepID=A0ABT7F074_9RHOB|nr:ComF family protein [Pseudodonghicola flavimaris]MDK3017894.1 ComF family protein [Pseudodonghicola flavimaris]